MRRNTALSIDHLDHMQAYDDETSTVSEKRNTYARARLDQALRRDASSSDMHILHKNRAPSNPEAVQSPARELIERLRQELLQKESKELSATETADQPHAAVTQQTFPQDNRTETRSEQRAAERQREPLSAWQRLEQDLGKAQGTRAQSKQNQLDQAIGSWLSRLKDEQNKREELVGISRCQEAIQVATSAVDSAEQKAIDHEKRLQLLTENLERLVNFLDSSDIIRKDPPAPAPVSYPVSEQAETEPSDLRSARITEQLEQALNSEILKENELRQDSRENSRASSYPSVTEKTSSVDYVAHSAEQLPDENSFAAFYAASPSPAISRQPVNTVTRKAAEPSVAARPHNSVRSPSAEHPAIPAHPPKSVSAAAPVQAAIPPRPPRPVSPPMGVTPPAMQAQAAPAPSRGTHAMGASAFERSAHSVNHMAAVRPIPAAMSAKESLSARESRIDISPSLDLSDDLFQNFSLTDDNLSEDRNTQEQSKPKAQKRKERLKKDISSPEVSHSKSHKKLYILLGCSLALLTALGVAGLTFGIPGLSDREMSPIASVSGITFENQTNTSAATNAAPTRVITAALPDNMELPDTRAMNAGAGDDYSDPQTTSSVQIKSVASSGKTMRIAEIGGLGELPVINNRPELREAALSGDPFAVYEIAHRLETGMGVVRDVYLSSKLFERAAEQGFVPAQTRIAQQYEKGIGVERDPVIAREWYRRAAESGNILAMRKLAMVFAQGVGGPTDYPSAVLWFKRAAKFGDKDSQFNFAILASKGLGMKPSLVQAYIHFAAAANQGDTEAADKRDQIGSSLSAEDLAFAKKSAGQWKDQAPDNAANNTPDISL